MKDLSGKSDREVLEGLKASAAEHRENQAQLLAVLAEIGARHAYRPESDSLLDFCINRMNIDEEDAALYVAVAPVARRYPTIFERIADGRLHLEGLAILAPHLDGENVIELLDAATHQVESQIRTLLRGRPKNR